MGMYTQVRGWLNIDSIGDRASIDQMGQKLSDVMVSFENRIDSENIRSWVCHDTVLHLGGNGSKYLFFGTELKNYNDEAEKWIDFLLLYFPSAEGRIDFQYEDEDPDDKHSTSKYWLIRSGKIVEMARCKTWCIGYGNSYKEVAGNG